ncbi:hypothetical protein C8J56DRAFT_1037720 [Mycena floridula]|nr:hypothetical protein C8J56DRAFT_1037720 [Mycena floridula]
MKIPCGTAGLANWSKLHWGSKQCSDNLKVWQRTHNSDKQVGMMDMWRRKGAEKKAALVPATVSAPSLVHGNIRDHDLVVSGEGNSDSGPIPDTLPACPDAVRLIDALRTRARALPLSVPEDSGEDLIARKFAADPRSFDGNGLDGWETLDPLLNSLVGWNADDDEVSERIRRGENGMDALVHFLEYFVQSRAVHGPVLGEKVKRLLCALDILCPASTPMVVQPSNEIQFIDVDAVPVENTAPPKQCRRRYRGFRLAFPPDKSPYSTYPFALHDKLSLVWDPLVTNGLMNVTARACARFALPSCRHKILAKLAMNFKTIPFFKG